MAALKGNPLATREGSIVEIIDIGKSDSFYQGWEAGKPVDVVMTLNKPAKPYGHWYGLFGQYNCDKTEGCFFAAKYKVLYY